MLIDRSPPPTGEGIAYGRFVLALHRHRLVLGIILNLAGGFLGWFLKGGQISGFGPFFLLVSVAVSPLPDAFGGLFVATSVLSAVIYGVVTYREIRSDSQVSGSQAPQALG